MNNSSSTDFTSPFDEAERLRAAGELDAAIARLESELASDDVPAQRRRLAAFLLSADRIDDAAAALERGLELATSSGDHGEVAEIRYALGRVRARQEDFETALAHLDAASSHERELKARGLHAACLLAIGEVHAQLGRWTRAVGVLERAVEVAAAASDSRADHARALERLADVLVRTRRWQEAQTAAESALEVAERVDDPALLARALALVGWLADRQHDARRMHDSYTRSVALAEQVGDVHHAVATLADHAEACLRARMPRPAVALLERGLELAERLGDAALRMQSHELRAATLLMLGEADAAVAELERALEIARESGDGVDRILAAIAEAHAEAGRFESAVERQKQCVAGARDAGDRRGEIRGEIRLGEIALDGELWGEAAKAFDRAVGLAEQAGDEVLAATALGGKAAMLERRGDHQLAIVFHGRRLGIVQKLGDEQATATASLDIARAQRKSGRGDGARHHLEQGLRAARAARRRLVEAEILHELGLCARLDRAAHAARKNLAASARCYLDAGRLRQATQILDELWAMYVDEGDPDAIGGVVRDVVEASLRGGPRRGQLQRLHDGARLLLHFGQFEAAGKRLSAAQKELDRDVSARLRGGLLQTLGQASRLAGDCATAVQHFRGRVELERERGHPRELAYALNSLGAVLVDVGEIDESLRTFEEALALMEEIGDPGGLAVVLNGIAMPLHRAGRSDDALEALDRGIAVQQQRGRASDVSVTLNTRGEILRELGRIDDSIRDLERCLELTDAAHDERGLAFVLPRLGRARLAAGRVDQALADLERGVEVATRNPDRLQAVRALSAFGEALVAAGRSEAALEPLERGLALADQLGLSELSGSMRAIQQRIQAKSGTP